MLVGSSTTLTTARMAGRTMGKLRLSWEDTGRDSARVVIAGQIDSHNRAQLETFFDDIMRRKARRNIDCDMQDLDYIGSAGLGLFIAFMKDAHEAGGKLKLLNLQKHVRDVFALIGLDVLEQ